MLQTQPITELVDNLPTSNVTVYLLRGLDFAVPGEWQNLTGFDNSIRTITGETDKNLIRQIRDRAIQLYNDPSEGYQQAIWLYQNIDRADSALGAAAMANKIGEKVGFLSFLNQLTPKADIAQSIDLVLKLVVELIACSKINGIPGNKIGEFAAFLGNYNDEALMRMAALVCVDALIPLGPDFTRKVQSTLGSLNPAALQQSSTFQRLSGAIPGGSTGDKLNFIGQTFASVQGWMSQFVRDRNLTPETVVSHLKQYIDVTDDRLDYVAAFLDMTTNYYEHTGTQTVARSLIERAAAEI